ncbi:hypothetical protein Taro_009898 [Colocasia esculenta]|uniref:Uncharacterized protein n=1 Tax=Colocasia esculenta TaxID=4460 RepID=A0A843U5A8_COLES|nr:hypothetical protein [Colocasia esculenta]
MGQIQYSEKYFDDTYEYRPSGVRSVCSRAGDGFITRFTGRSRTSCCSEGRLITSSSKRTRLPNNCWASDQSIFPGLSVVYASSYDTSAPLLSIYLRLVCPPTSLFI